jgi:methylamine dehydrogenase accessory protein MauD
MEGSWLVSYIILWIITLLLVIVVLAHSRLLGLLNYRFGPANAKPLADGPEIGAKLSKLTGIYPNQEKWKVRFPFSTDLVLVFVSPQCSTCNEVLPHIKDFIYKDSSVKTILVSTIDDPGMNQAYIAYRKLEKMEYIMGEQLSQELNIEGVPYALYVNQAGIVKAKGLVNNYENLLGLKRFAQQAE